ncbi:MAG: polysaccharide biosynthesis/export family protein [Chitinophagaceae bacterium]
MYRQYFLSSLFPLLGMAFFCSCKTSKQLPYFKDLSDDAMVSKIKTTPYTPLKLQANDEVQLTISSISSEASQFFNLMTIAPAAPVDGAVPSGQSQGFMNIYRVSDSGYLTLPVLGNIRAAGSTTEELKVIVAEKLRDYLKDAIVTIRLTNFKVTVIGEVGRPVVIPVNGQTINVLEAVGAAGDMTVYGIRKNVKVIRKLPDGNTEVALLNFNKSNVLQSPWFQLRQNDIVYIQPNRSKGILGTRTAIWAPIITSLVYIAAVIVTRN